MPPFVNKNLINNNFDADKMTFYEKEVARIRSICYSNEKQIASVIATRKFMDDHFEKDLNLDYLSHIHFTSKYHLIRLFKKYYGQTPRQYLMDKRVEKAKECLIAGMTVTEACCSVGFESLSSFSKLFKTRTGKSPSEFRKEQLSTNEFNSNS